jgi:perosamine synthetase
MVPHNRPSYDSQEINATRATIKSRYIAQGQKVLELEDSIAKNINKKYGVAVSSGTAALTVALKVLGISAGDEVLIPTYTCAALWHAVKAVNGIPILTDIEPIYYNMSPEEIQRKASPRTKAIIFPHMFGQPGRIREILDLGIPVIEDIAQAYGATIDNQPVGAFGHITVISFYTTKVIGGGEGGMVLTDNQSLAEQMKDMREYDEKEDLNPRFNLKMSDLHAAIALEQLKKFPDFLTKRQSICQSYIPFINPFIKIPVSDRNHKPNLYRCLAVHPKKSADEIIQLGQDFEITLRKPIFRPLHHYLHLRDFPVAEEAWHRHFSIPLFPDMDEGEIEKVTKFLKKLVERVV